MWFRTGLAIPLLTSHANFHSHAIRKQQFGTFPVFIYFHNFGAVFVCQHLGKFQRIALYCEIQIADGKASEHVPHSAARKKDIEIGLGRGFAYQG